MHFHCARRPINHSARRLPLRLPFFLCITAISSGDPYKNNVSISDHLVFFHGVAPTNGQVDTGIPRVHPGRRHRYRASQRLLNGPHTVATSARHPCSPAPRPGTSTAGRRTDPRHLRDYYAFESLTDALAQDVTRVPCAWLECGMSSSQATDASLVLSTRPGPLRRVFEAAAMP